MIKPLCIVTRGLLSDPLAVATRGYICVVTQSIGGGPPVCRTVKVPDCDLSKVSYEQLVREDEELIAIIVTAIAEGVIP